jgi:hypothetical protein
MKLRRIHLTDFATGTVACRQSRAQSFTNAPERVTCERCKFIIESAVKIQSLRDKMNRRLNVARCGLREDPVV